MSKDVQVLFTSTERTATDSRTFSTECCEGLFYINVTAASLTPSVVFTIAGLDPVGSTAYTILASAAITGTGLTVLRVSPQLTAAANTIAKDMLPMTMKVTATHADTDPITYSFSFVGVGE